MSLAVLFVVVFVNVAGFGLIIPLLPLYAREHHATGTAIGALVAVYALMQFLFAPVWGRLSDRIGRRPVLMLCLGGAAVGHLLFAAAQSLPMLFAARVVAGLFAATVGTAQAAVADVTAPEERARGMGIVGAAFGLGFVFGPPLGGFLAMASMRRGLDANVFPGVFAAGFALAALVVTFLWLGLRPAQLAAEGRAEARPAFGRYFFVYGAIVLALTGLETVVPIHARERLGMNAVEVGLLFGMLGAVLALVQATAVGPLARRAGERRVLLFATGGLALSLAAVPFAADRLWLYVLAALVAATEGLALPLVQTLVSADVPAARQGAVLGILASTGSLAQIAGSMTAGVSYEWAGGAAPFFAAALIVAAALGSMLRISAHQS